MEIFRYGSRFFGRESILLSSEEISNFYCYIKLLVIGHVQGTYLQLGYGLFNGFIDHLKTPYETTIY
jgi:hypothetical protein